MTDLNKNLADRGERVSLMEPLRLGSDNAERPVLTDLATELAMAATRLRRGLHDGIARSLAGLVRSMNCYYSNLIEGHHTHPVDIERALAGDYSADPGQRDLQNEAAAHIAVQRWIDDGGLDGRALSVAGIREMHQRFCRELPESMLVVIHPTTGEQLTVEPGGLRQHDVQVGKLVPVSPGAVPRFLERFEQAYSGLGISERILSTAAAHHRLVWIHPFLDGNGRVARLSSYAILREALDSGGIWSVSRGLARNVDRYKALLAACDAPRKSDLDGRGNLSESALSEFTRFFLEVCIDQVRFMETLLSPGELETRVLVWAREEMAADRLPTKSDAVLKAVLFRGSLDRGEVPAIVGATDRHARRITSALASAGAISSSSTRAPLELAFPATLAGRWMPGLFPERR